MPTARPRQCDLRRSALASALALVLAAGVALPFPGRVAALLSGGTDLAENTFSTLSLGAPGALTGQAQGHDVALSWGAGQNGSGYLITAVGNGTSSDCSQVTWNELGTSTGTTYTDSGRHTPQGSWHCYQVQTTHAGWTSPAGNPAIAVQLGFVASQVSFVNGGDTSGCSGWQSGQAGDLDCGDQVAVSFNQAVDTGSGPASGDTVCAHEGSDTLWLGSTTTDGECAAYEATGLGALSGSTVGNCNCRFSASFDWAADGRTITVTVGALTAGSGYPSLGASLWTFAPTTDTAKLLSASGGYHVCDTNDTGEACRPSTP